MYDLSWIMTTVGISSTLDLALVRRLAVLKIWVDAYGVHGGNSFWKQGHESCPFEPKIWLRTRNITDINADDIGALAGSAPAFDELSKTIAKTFEFLVDLSEEEMVISHVRGKDRPLALKMLRDLPNGRLRDIGLY